MDKVTELTILYDYYGELFNDQQQTYFEDYYFQNLSLSEMAENYNVSRANVHKIIKSVEEKLYEYEEKLKLHKKSIKLSKIIDSIDDDNLKKKLQDIIV